MNTNSFSHLTDTQIDLLKSLGNTCNNWHEVVFAPECDLTAITCNRFEGKVKVGLLDGKQRRDTSFPLYEGIRNSTLVDCTVGDHCTIDRVGLIEGYTIGAHSLIFNVGELRARRFDATLTADCLHPIEVMNENGGRKVIPFAGMTVGEAYLWARFRGRQKLMQRLEEITLRELAEHGYASVAQGSTIKNCLSIKDVAVMGSLSDPTTIEECTMLHDGVVGSGSCLKAGIIAERFLTGEHVNLEFGLRINDSIVGDNSTLARCEVGCSLIFPSHQQHHNNSFLIAALVEGQSNLAAGATIGSNHNGRTAEGELAAARGFWPGLCVSLKHPSVFAAYTLLAKGSYPHELDICLPFCLVNNNESLGRLELLPAYWWRYNMYALQRCETKFASRDHRVIAKQPVENSFLAPDTVEQILAGRSLLEQWIASASADGTVRAKDVEKSKRDVVVLHAAEGVDAYNEMLFHYAVGTLRAMGFTPEYRPSEGYEHSWINLGGQLIAGRDMQALIHSIEGGELNSWADIDRRLAQLWDSYPAQKMAHAYHTLLSLRGLESITPKCWALLLEEHDCLLATIDDRCKSSREKDNRGHFAMLTYRDADERSSVLG